MIMEYQYLRIWELECRREPAGADLRPHSSEFSQVLSIPHFAQKKKGQWPLTCFVFLRFLAHSIRRR
jgi:hypothetical protein